MTEEVQRLSNPSGKGKLIAPIGPCKNVSFLASQGPTKLTNHHYLQMIHEQKADAIVMLTRLVETIGQGMCIKVSLAVKFYKYKQYEYTITFFHPSFNEVSIFS